ncbi:probable protein kinase A, catalytic subunit [Pseudozyma flocculosa]|uniref:cAMP-dependent protein kinase n=1 Tax=Pseudozyma flocculosa TaxID=84751 RepID=A0A5C3F937_9BASI|nr:probable protein kinase A, catalytic subunit [Pseudozyma flocculosa]
MSSANQQQPLVSVNDPANIAPQPHNLPHNQHQPHQQIPSIPAYNNPTSNPAASQAVANHPSTAAVVVPSKPAAGQQPHAAASHLASANSAGTYSSTSLPLAIAAQQRKLSGRYALADFAVERTLGTGSFGRVHLVRSRHNQRFYAIKVLRKDQVVKMKQVEHTNSERAVLSIVRHPFLVNLWGTFKDPTFLYMVMDYVPGGELFTLLRKSLRFPHPVAKFYAAEVALAIDYLHQNNIVYRDLKPENILLGADGHLKITDFGFAKYVPDVTWTLCGTPDYLAPEIVSSKGYNKSVDWHPPFFTEDGNPIKLYEKIIACKVRYPPYFEAGVKDLLKSLLTADLSKRFGNLHRGSKDIFEHLWFAEVDWDRLYRRDIPAPYLPTVTVDGDSSQFERYPENDISDYNRPDLPDKWGDLFPDF